MAREVRGAGGRGAANIPEARLAAGCGAGCVAASSGGGGARATGNRGDDCGGTLVEDAGLNRGEGVLGQADTGDRPGGGSVLDVWPRGVAARRSLSLFLECCCCCCS